MKIFDCLELRDNMETAIKNYVNKCKELGISRPCLTVISVGEDKASQSYIKSKETACHRTGIVYRHIELNELTTEDWLIKKVRECNNNKLINGLIVQFPIKSNYKISDEVVLNEIDPSKDVDGLTPVSMGRLASNNKPIFIPCTAKGVIDIFNKQLKYDLHGKHVVIIGKGKTSGRPLSLLLPKYGATVSVVDSKTPEDVKDNLLLMADVVISCTGRPNSVNVRNISRVKPTTLINVGMNRLDGKLVGDIDLKSIEDYEKMFSYTVDTQVNKLTNSTGIMTVTNLLFNTCIAHLTNEVKYEHYNELVETIKELF